MKGDCDMKYLWGTLMVLAAIFIIIGIIYFVIKG